MRQIITTWIGTATVAALALASGGCATTELTTDYDQHAEFERYDSYTIAAGPVVTDGAVTAVPNQIAQNRIDARLGQALSAKGLSPAKPEAADLIVTYTALARDRQDLVNEDFGPEPWPLAGDVWIENYREALLTVDVRDADTQKTVFSATTRTKNEDFSDPEFVADVVNRALEDFPQGGP